MTTQNIISAHVVSCLCDTVLCNSYDFLEKLYEFVTQFLHIFYYDFGILFLMKLNQVFDYYNN